MKFNLSVKSEANFINIGNVRPNKSGKSFSLTLFADKVNLLNKSDCGKFLNCLMVEDKREDRPLLTNPFEITTSNWQPENGGENQ